MIRGEVYSVDETIINVTKNIMEGQDHTIFINRSISGGSYYEPFASF
jgi:hypothetical protein